MASTAATPDTVTPDSPVHIEERLDMAAKASDAGDYEAALAMFREVLAENPTVTDAYIGIGDVYMETQDYAKAEPAFDRAARLEPRNFDAQYGHGRALQMLNRLVEAIRAYHRALVIEPDHPQCNANMATTYMQLGEPQNAVSFAERAVQLDSSSGPAHANLGAIYENLGRYADAVAQYDAAVELMEPTPPLLLNLINALSKEARYEEARNTAEVLIKLQPSANAYERLGWACFRLGNYGASLDSYRKGVEMDLNHWPSLNGVGVNSLNAWLLSGKRDEASAREAKDAFQRSLRANPEQPKVRRLLTDYQF
jgi:tetratricopeptide (TPR) repeat protein